MIRIYCPVCNGLVQLTENRKEAFCASCGRKIQIPKGYSRLESSYLYAAENMQRRDFAAARAAYQEIAADNPDQAEAFFRKALADYEVEYAKTADGSYRMVCHQAQKSDFTQDADVRRALSLAEPGKREEYAAQAQEVETLQKAVASYAAGHAPVDIWLEADRMNIFALDEVIRIRQMIERMGLSVFCPALDLDESESALWESALYRAATTAKAMVIIATERNSFTDEVNFNVLRFLYMKEKAQREARRQIPALFLAFKGIDEYEDIPDAWFDGLDDRLAMENTDFSARLENLLSSLSKGFGTSVFGQEAKDFSYTNMLLKARQALESGRFEEASKQYNDILLRSPSESQAYWGLLLADRRCASEQALIESGLDITAENNYRNALAFANERQRQTWRDVAAGVREMASVHEAQAREAERQAALQEEQRQEKAKEVSEEKSRQYKEEMKSRGKWKRRLTGLVFLLFVGAIGGVIGYQVWLRTDAGVTATSYKEAVSTYRASTTADDFYEVYQQLTELGDYKDSASLASLALDRYCSFIYNEAVNDIEDMSTRIRGVNKLNNVAPYLTNAQNKLDELYAEGLAYLEAGDYSSAWYTLAGFDREDPNVLEAWRRVFYMGLLSGGGNASVLAVTGEGTLIYTDGLSDFAFEDGTVLSANVSDSGNSVSVVRSDGTAYLLGSVQSHAGSSAVSGWSDLICIQVCDTAAAALDDKGNLYISGSGVTTSDVVQFDMDDSGTVIAVRSDGSLYCSQSGIDLSGGCSEYSYVCAAIADNVVFAVTGDGTIYNVTTDNMTSHTDVAVIFSGCGRIGWLCTDDTQNFYYYDVDSKDSGSKTTYDAYFGSFLSYGEATTGLYATNTGSINAHVSNPDSDLTVIRDEVRDLAAMGVPE